MNGILAWDKKKGKKPNKTSIIQGVEASPAVKSAKEWFEMIDVDGSGELDQDELATLYQKARGEKLKGKQVREVPSNDSKMPADGIEAAHCTPTLALFTHSHSSLTRMLACLLPLFVPCAWSAQLVLLVTHTDPTPLRPPADLMSVSDPHCTISRHVISYHYRSSSLLCWRWTMTTAAA
eukprot:COSAG06_NODE_3252_length_5612_cov_786.685652_6_plen_179_part_00